MRRYAIVIVFTALLIQPVVPFALGQIPLDVLHKTPSLSESKGNRKGNATIRYCRVISVHDGDSMRMRCPGFRNTLRIRLDQIDAPELTQAHGKKSREFLRSLCPHRSSAVLHDLGVDSYNRHLARIYCQGIDVNAAMVKSGAAWVYDYHASDRDLYRLQNAAQAQKRGIWSGPAKPTPPWEFRYRQRQQGAR